MVASSVDFGSFTLSFSQLTLIGYILLQFLLLLLVLCCTKSTVKEIFQRHQTYQSAIVHAFDMGSDLAVIVEFYFLGIEGGTAYYNPLKLCYAMVFVHLFMYRFLSSIQIYISTKKLKASKRAAAINGALQFCDILIFREVFMAFREKRTQPTVLMHQIKRLEATLESACQIFIQFTYFFKTHNNSSGIATSDFLVVISLLFSITSVANIITRVDDFSFVGHDSDPEELKEYLFRFRRRFPPSGPFFIRLFFRFSEILGRIVLVSLFWLFTNGNIVSIVLFIELVWYSILYMNSLIGGNWLYIVSFLIFHPNLSITIEISKMLNNKLYKLLYCWIPFYSISKSLDEASIELMISNSQKQDSNVSNVPSTALSPVASKLNNFSPVLSPDNRKARDELAASKGVTLQERRQMFKEHARNDSEIKNKYKNNKQRTNHKKGKSGSDGLMSHIAKFNAGQVSNATKYENPNQAIDTAPVLKDNTKENETKEKEKEKEMKETGKGKNGNGKGNGKGKRKTNGKGKNKSSSNGKATHKTSDKKTTKKGSKNGSNNSEKKPSAKKTGKNKNSNKNKSKNKNKKTAEDSPKETKTKTKTKTKGKTTKGTITNASNSDSLSSVSVQKKDRKAGSKSKKRSDAKSSSKSDGDQMKMDVKSKKARQNEEAIITDKKLVALLSSGLDDNNGDRVEIVVQRSVNDNNKDQDQDNSGIDSDSTNSQSSQGSTSQSSRSSKRMKNYDENSDSNNSTSNGAESVNSMDEESMIIQSKKISLLSQESTISQQISSVITLNSNISNFKDGRGNLLVRVHYFHLFCKSLIYLLMINLIYLGKKTDLVDFNEVFNYKISFDEAFEFIDNSTLGKIVYAISIIAPLISFILGTWYVAKVATQPDIITLAKYNWVEAIEDVIRNEPSKRTQFIHSIDNNGMHLLFIILYLPMQKDSNRSFNDITDMIDYLLLAGKGSKYINRFYNEHNPQAIALLNLLAEYMLDLAWDPKSSSASDNQRLARALTRVRSPEHKNNDGNDGDDDCNDGVMNRTRGMTEFKPNLGDDEDIPKYKIGYGVTTIGKNVLSKSDKRGDLIVFLNYFRAKVGRLSNKDSAQFFQRFMTLMMNCYLFGDEQNGTFSLKSLTKENYDANPIALAFTQLRNFFGPWKTSMGKVQMDSILMECNELFRTFFRLYIDFALEKMKNSNSDSESVNNFYQSAIHEIVVCFGIDILSRYFNSTQYEASEAIIYWNNISSHYEVATIKQFRNGKIIPVHNSNIEIDENDIFFSVAVHYDAEFTKEILKVPVNPKARNNVISTTFRTSWEVTNTGEKEFGFDIGITIVKGKWLTLVDGSVSNAEPNETIRIDCTFHFEMNRNNNENENKKTIVYSDDLMYNIRIGKRINHKSDQIRPFGTVGRFELILGASTTKELEICQGSNPNDMSDDADGAQEIVCQIM